MRKISVLLTGVGAPGAPGIIKSLRSVDEREIQITGVDMDENSVGFGLVDSWYVIPPAFHTAFIPRIVNICQKEKIDVIIPLVTNELKPFSVNKNVFGEYGVKVSISDPSALQIANNKHLLMEYCQRIGVPTPYFIKVDSFEEFKNAVFELGYPGNRVCFKPPISNGLRGFRVLTKDIDRLDFLLNKKPTSVFTTFEDVAPVLQESVQFPELLVMEYLPGEEYSVDVLAKNGGPLIIVPRLREKIKMGISFVGKTVNHQGIINYASKVVRGLKLNGNIGLQFRDDENKVPKLIESNPRVQGTIVLCTAAGANLVYYAVKQALGESLKIPKINWGLKMIRYWEEVYYDES